MVLKTDKFFSKKFENTPEAIYITIKPQIVPTVL